MNKILLTALAAASALALAGPVAAQSVSGVVDITGSVADKCIVTDDGTPPSGSFGGSVNLGQLDDTDGTLKDSSVLETAWRRKWSGGSPGCFGLMGGLAARSRRPWPLLGLFCLWEVFILYVNLRDYTSVFHFVALFTGYLMVRYLIPPPAR